MTGLRSETNGPYSLIFPEFSRLAREMVTWYVIVFLWNMVRFTYRLITTTTNFGKLLKFITLVNRQNHLLCTMSSKKLNYFSNWSNCKDLQNICHKLLTSISSKVGKKPLEFQHLCNMYIEIGTKSLD